MKPNTASTHSLMPWITAFAVLALLVQCFGMLTEPAARLGASHGESAVFATDPHGGHGLMLASGFTESDHSGQGHAGSARLMPDTAPVMSCCDDESQPITLAEIQLLSLIFILGLFTLLIVTSQAPKPRALPLSSRIRLHKLHCCWLN